MYLSKLDRNTNSYSRDDDGCKESGEIVDALLGSQFEDLESVMQVCEMEMKATLEVRRDARLEAIQSEKHRLTELYNLLGATRKALEKLHIEGRGSMEGNPEEIEHSIQLLLSAVDTVEKKALDELTQQRVSNMCASSSCIDCDLDYRLLHQLDGVATT